MFRILPGVVTRQAARQAARLSTATASANDVNKVYNSYIFTTGLIGGALGAFKGGYESDNKNVLNISVACAYLGAFVGPFVIPVALFVLPAYGIGALGNFSSKYLRSNKSIARARAEAAAAWDDF